MTHVNNIFNLQINNISSSASVNFGNTIHRGHSVSQKQVGGQSSTGFVVNSPTNFDKNIVYDPDFKDQTHTSI